MIREKVYTDVYHSSYQNGIARVKFIDLICKELNGSLYHRICNMFLKVKPANRDPGAYREIPVKMKDYIHAYTNKIGQVAYSNTQSAINYYILSKVNSNDFYSVYNRIVSLNFLLAAKQQIVRKVINGDD